MTERFLTLPRCALAGALFALSLVAVPQAGAVVLAQNLHVNGETSGNNHYSGGTTIGAENFSLASAFEITQISHVGHHSRGTAQPTSIDWYLYADAAGTPGAIIASAAGAAYSTAVEGTSGGFDLTRYLINVSVNLAAGNYWVGFHNNGGQPGDPHWTFASSGTSYFFTSRVDKSFTLFFSTLASIF